MEVIVVFITFPSEECARHIGTVLVQKQLAACVNLTPKIRSIYQWEGEIKDDEEVLAMLKTTKCQYSELEAAALELHPYENPEIIALPVENGSNAYLSWVRQQLGEGS